MNNKCNQKQCKNCSQKSNSMYPSIDANPDDLNDITTVFLILTKSCNLACKYCFVEQEPENMTYDIAQDAVEFIYNNSIKMGKRPAINFFGGEPMVKWDEIVKPLTEYIRNRFGNEFDLSMTTNGLLLDKEKIEFLKNNNVGLLLSMDGDKKTQDLNRPQSNGEGSFDYLDSLIPTILEYYPNITFRSTTDFDNVEEFVNNHKYAVGKGFKSVFNIVNVFSEWSTERREELKYAVDELGEYYLEQLRDGNLVNFGPFDDMFGKLERIKTAVNNNEFRVAGEGLLANGRCGLGATIFASVGTDGKLYSCQEMVGNKKYGDTFEIGNIYDGTDNAKRIDIAKGFSIKNVVNSVNPNRCKSCRMNPICDGSCVINNYFVTGDLNIMPDILCYYYSILLDKADEIKDELLMLKKKLREGGK